MNTILWILKAVSQKSVILAHPKITFSKICMPNFKACYNHLVFARVHTNFWIIIYWVSIYWGLYLPEFILDTPIKGCLMFCLETLTDSLIVVRSYNILDVHVNTFKSEGFLCKCIHFFITRETRMTRYPAEINKPKKASVKRNPLHGQPAHQGTFYGQLESWESHCSDIEKSRKKWKTENDFKRACVRWPRYKPPYVNWL